MLAMLLMLLLSFRKVRLLSAEFFTRWPALQLHRYIIHIYTIYMQRMHGLGKRVSLWERAVRRSICLYFKDPGNSRAEWLHF